MDSGENSNAGDGWSAATCSQLIHDAEEAAKIAIEKARLAQHAVMRFRDDEGAAPPSIALMQIGVSNLQNGNDALRFARHALPLVFSANAKEQQPEP